MVCLFYLIGGSISWAADPTVAAKVISEAGAKQVLSVAEHEAEALHAPCAIAVVDANGILVAFLKMDGVRRQSGILRSAVSARTSAFDCKGPVPRPRAPSTTVALPLPPQDS